MSRFIRCGAVVIALSAGIGHGVAQTTMMEMRIDLTPAQKATIYRTVIKEPVARGMPMPDVHLDIGRELPPGVQLYTLPSAAVAEIPSMQVFRYTIVRDEVLLVDPDSRKVVEIIRE